MAGDGVLDELPLTLPWSHGRTVTVRVGTVDDVDEVLAMYQQLPDRDRYRRFFTTVVPQAKFVRRMLSGTGPDGCMLVVEGTDPDGASRIVAEAGYQVPEGRDPDLAMAVATEWRGWLGPWLLDRILRVAAEHGVTHLYADVLVENRVMLSLLEHRGYAVVDHPDGPTARIVVGTASRVPPWPDGDERPRVLVSAAGGRWYAEQAVRAAGMQVVVCPGHRAKGSPPCPMLEGETCPLVEEADAVVVALSPKEPATAELVEAHRQVGRVPVCVQSVRGIDIEPPPGGVAMPRGTDEAEIVAWLLSVAGRRRDAEPAAEGSDGD